MSNPPAGAVGVGRALWVLYRLMLRECARWRRIVGMVVVGGALIAIVAATRAQSDDPAVDAAGTVSDAASVLNNVGFTQSLPLMALLFAALPLGSLRSGRALSFIWLTAVGRWVVCLAATLAGATVALPLATVSLVVAAAAAGGSTGLVLGAAVGGVVGTLAWCSVVVAVSLTVGRVLLWGIGYILLVETFLSSPLVSDSAISYLSLSRYLRSPLQEWAGQVGSASGVYDYQAASLNPVVAIVVVLGVAVAGVWLGALRLSRMTLD